MNYIITLTYSEEGKTEDKTINTTADNFYFDSGFVVFYNETVGDEMKRVSAHQTYNIKYIEVDKKI